MKRFILGSTLVLAIAAGVFAVAANRKPVPPTVVSEEVSEVFQHDALLFFRTVVQTQLVDGKQKKVLMIAVEGQGAGSILLTICRYPSVEDPNAAKHYGPGMVRDMDPVVESSRKGVDFDTTAGNRFFVQDLPMDATLGTVGLRWEGTSIK